MSSSNEIAQLQQRLYLLEAEKHVRACMNRYMSLCDLLGVDFPLPDLMALFTEDAVWEGKGSRYASTFGRYDGRDAITDMFAKYTKAPAHFVMNVHFMANELIVVNDDSAEGSWLLLQPSTFTTGTSQLSCARIKAVFRCIDQQWLISYFQTENVFSRPMQQPWDQSAPPVPD